MFIKHLAVALGAIFLLTAGCNKVVAPEQTNPVTNEQPQNVVASDSVQPVEPSTETANWNVYKNTEYGFQLTFTEAWKGYKVESVPDSSLAGTRHILFKVPTADVGYGDGSGYAKPLSINVFPLRAWEQLQKEGGRRIPDVLARNEAYVFAYSPWQDPPEDLREKDFDYETVLSTFTLSK